jgi:hypothetical protein
MTVNDGGWNRKNSGWEARDRNRGWARETRILKDFCQSSSQKWITWQRE